MAPEDIRDWGRRDRIEGVLHPEREPPQILLWLAGEALGYIGWPPGVLRLQYN